MGSLKLSIEVSRFARSITVKGGRVVTPTKITSSTVIYKPSSHPLTMFMIALSFVVGMASIAILGPLSLAILVVVMFIIWKFESRRRQLEVSRLRELLPESTVLSIVREAISKCSSSNEPIANFKHRNIEVSAYCGTPHRCIEYDKQNVSKLTSIYLCVAVVVLVACFLLDPVLRIPILVGALLIVLYASRTKICRKYLIKKEEIVFSGEN